MNEKVAYLLELFGTGLLAIGGFYTFANWIFFFMNRSNQQRGIDRHVSMVGCLGLCLPLGCLLIPSLRWHALWVALLDPCFFWLLKAIPELLKGMACHPRLTIQWMIEDITHEDRR